MEVNIYTDGSWDSKRKNGGWAYYLYEGDRCHEDSGHAVTTTNNRMELMAILKALTFIKEQVPSLFETHLITIHTDSQYCIRAIQPAQPTVKLNAISKAIRETIENYEVRIKMVHVRGHSGDLYNEHVDKLAVAARFEGLRAQVETTKEIYR